MSSHMLVDHSKRLSSNVVSYRRMPFSFCIVAILTIFIRPTFPIANGSLTVAMVVSSKHKGPGLQMVIGYIGV